MTTRAQEYELSEWYVIPEEGVGIVDVLPDRQGVRHKGEHYKGIATMGVSECTVAVALEYNDDGELVRIGLMHPNIFSQAEFRHDVAALHTDSSNRHARILYENSLLTASIEDYEHWIEQFTPDTTQVALIGRHHYLEERAALEERWHALKTEKARLDDAIEAIVCSESYMHYQHVMHSNHSRKVSAEEIISTVIGEIVEALLPEEWAYLEQDVTGRLADVLEDAENIDKFMVALDEIRQEYDLEPDEALPERVCEHAADLFGHYAQYHAVRQRMNDAHASVAPDLAEMHSLRDALSTVAAQMDDIRISLDVFEARANASDRLFNSLQDTLKSRGYTHIDCSDYAEQCAEVYRDVLVTPDNIDIQLIDKSALNPHQRSSPYMPECDRCILNTQHPVTQQNAM